TALGAIGLGYAVVAALGIRESGRVEAEPVRQGFLAAAVEVFRLPGYRVLFTVFGAISVANWVIYTWLPLYLFERFGMSLKQAGFAATFYLQAGSLAGVGLGGW